MMEPTSKELETRVVLLEAEVKMLSSKLNVSLELLREAMEIFKKIEEVAAGKSVKKEPTVFSKTS